MFLTKSHQLWQRLWYSQCHTPPHTPSGVLTIVRVVRVIRVIQIFRGVGAYHTVRYDNTARPFQPACKHSVHTAAPQTILEGGFLGREDWEGLPCILLWCYSGYWGVWFTGIKKKSWVCVQDDTARKEMCYLPVFTALQIKHEHLSFSCVRNKHLAMARVDSHMPRYIFIVGQLHVCVPPHWCKSYIGRGVCVYVKCVPPNWCNSYIGRGVCVCMWKCVCAYT